MLAVFMKNKSLIFLKVLKLVIGIVLGTIGGNFVMLIDITTIAFTMKTFALTFLAVFAVFLVATIWFLLDLLVDNMTKDLEADIKVLEEELLED